MCWRFVQWITKVVSRCRWRGGVKLGSQEMHDPPPSTGRKSRRWGEWTPPGESIKQPQLSDAELWHSYRKQVEDAQDHPTTTALDRYLLAPERLSKDEREDLSAHIRKCLRCQDIESYYRTHHDFLRLRKDCD